MRRGAACKVVVSISQSYLVHDRECSCFRAIQGLLHSSWACVLPPQCYLTNKTCWCWWTSTAMSTHGSGHFLSPFWSSIMISSSKLSTHHKARNLQPRWAFQTLQSLFCWIAGTVARNTATVDKEPSSSYTWLTLSSQLAHCRPFLEKDDPTDHYCYVLLVVVCSDAAHQMASISVVLLLDLMCVGFTLWCWLLAVMYLQDTSAAAQSSYLVEIAPAYWR